MGSDRMCQNPIVWGDKDISGGDLLPAGPEPPGTGGQPLAYSHPQQQGDSL